MFIQLAATSGNTTSPSTPPTTSSSGTGSTMQNSQPQQQQTNWESRIRKRGTGVSPIVPIIILIVIIAAAAGGYFYFGKSLGNILPSSTLSTIGATTSISGSSNVSAISGCVNITAPGKYFVSSFKTTQAIGACVNVASSNVNLICDNSKVVGSGPFVDIPPFSYGIQIDGQKNVTVSGCNFKNFSYGLFVMSSNDLSINNNNFSVNYMANIYLNNTHNSILNKNYLSRAASIQGSLFVTNGTSGVSILNNTVEYNQYYGININSSNNTYINNFVNNTQYAFRCSTLNGFVVSSKASANTCFNNTGCGFVECRGINIPANISQITLQKQISSCGSITSGGVYTLDSNINERNFVNTSNPLALQYPCITVSAPNVKIECNGNSITNASVAISSLNQLNITVDNCKIEGSSSAAILLQNTGVSHFTNLTLENNSYGVEMTNASVNIFTNDILDHNTYGILMAASFSNSYQNINSSFNTYGVYLEQNSYSNNFNKDVIQNNTKMDVYTTPDSSNVSYNLMQSTICGFTNALWANNCKHFVATSLSYVPLSGCGTISSPGQYILKNSVDNRQGVCFNITNTQNVQLICSNQTITGGFLAKGPALQITNSKNISVKWCNFANFNNAVNVTNSSAVTINAVNVQGSNYGLVFYKVNAGFIYNSLVNSSNNVSIGLYKTYGSTLLNDIVTLGNPLNIAVLINNSQNNLIENNTGTYNYVGLELQGKSLNNTIINNTMLQNSQQDYQCVGNGGIAAEQGGINYGTTKLGCKWLAMITTSDPTIQCAATLAPNLFLLTQDYKYSTGATCFDAFANDTTINCNGHTIIATAGGTFALFKNSQHSELENCYLKGFVNTVQSTNSSVTVLNNTILDNASSSAAISVDFARLGAIVQANNVSTPNVGIRLADTSSGAMKNNQVSSAVSAYVLSNVTIYQIYNNTAAPSTLNGLFLANSIINSVQNNNFQSSNNALSCTGISQGQSNNTDQGGNICTVQTNCFWIKGSSTRCP